MMIKWQREAGQCGEQGCIQNWSKHKPHGQCLCAPGSFKTNAEEAYSETDTGYVSISS